MTQARREHSTPAISIADLNTEIDSEPRVLDVVLGENLGFARPRKVRDLITSNSDELGAYGSLAPMRGKSRGQHFTAYYLNEPQALLICMFSNTSRAAEVRKMLIDVFMEYRRQQAVPAKSTIPVKAHERRPSTKLDNALSLARSATRLEAVARTLEPRDRVLSTTVVDGLPVVFDAHDFDFRDGDVALGFDWDGKLIVSPVSTEGWDTRDSYRPGGVRMVFGEPRLDDGVTKRPSFFAIGKVVSPAEMALPGQYRGKRTKFRDEILRLLDTGMTNRQIAQETGATYQTVTHWRRWVQDRTSA